jgi:hypothetical protein
MQRREALRLFLTGGVLSAVPADLFGFFRDSHPASGYALRTLDAHQNELVVAMIDQIIPATDTPGAKAARVNEFIDVILTEWANDEERRNFLSGHADVEKQSNTLFGKNFAEASSERQIALLRSLDEAAAVARARSERKTRPPFWEPEGRDTQMQDDFFTVFKKMTVHGYYTSEIGFSQELKLQIIPGAQHGCIPAAPGAGDAEG